MLISKEEKKLIRESLLEAHGYIMDLQKRLEGIDPLNVNARLTEIIADIGRLMVDDHERGEQLARLEGKIDYLQKKLDRRTKLGRTMDMSSKVPEI